MLKALEQVIAFQDLQIKSNSILFVGFFSAR